MTSAMPVFADQNYISDIHKALSDDAPWSTPGLKAVAQFAWGIMLRQLSQYPMAAGKTQF